ncbi:MAG: MoaD/ThiS family protein [Actinomycetota bacterium]|nr:MoaD/ThiS family protein [Actinomycetota bacterium]
MIKVELPPHLRRFTQERRTVEVDVDGAATISSVLDAVEQAYPALRGTIRDHGAGPRRAFIRFFAAGEDLSLQSPETPLPDAVASGKEALMIVGAISGG